MYASSLAHVFTTATTVILMLSSNFIVASTTYTPKLLGSFKISNPAFVTLYENPASNFSVNRFDLIISTFNPIPFSTDTVEIVKGVGKYITDVTKIRPERLTTKTTWPNEATGVPGTKIFFFILFKFKILSILSQCRCTKINSVAVLQIFRMVNC